MRSKLTSTSTPVTPSSFIADQLSGFLVALRRESRQAMTQGFACTETASRCPAVSMLVENHKPAAPLMKPLRLMFCDVLIILSDSYTLILVIDLVRY